MFGEKEWKNLLYNHYLKISMDPLVFLVFLHSIGLTQKALCRIFEHREDYNIFYKDLSHESLRKLGFKDEKIQMILQNKEKLDTEKIIGLIEKLNIEIITIHNPLYPELLLQTPVRPYLLYVRGTLPTHTNLLSVVGSRKSTTYSRTTLSDILPELVRSGYGIIS